MKRFEFSLDRLLTTKRQLERLAELELLRAREAADTARARLSGLESQLARVSEQYGATVGRAMAPHQWAAASDLTERLGQFIQAAERVVVEADQKLNAAVRERGQLATEVEALTTLRQQQWDQWRADAQRADQGRLDELVQRRWMAARAEGAAESP